MLTSSSPEDQNTLSIFRLNSKVQNYPWGSSRDMARVLGRIPSGQPEAELWMGAHHAAPSPIVAEPGGAPDLLALLDREPQLASGKLSFLFKVLSAAQPLSLQCHPNSLQAERGFARENDLGVPLGAHNRNYKDPKHKPELIMALSNFSVMCGFLPYERIIARLRHYRVFELLPTSTHFEKQPEEHTLAELFGSIFDLNEETRMRATRRLMGRARLDIEDRNSRAAIGKWLIKLGEQYDSDPGILAAILLHFLELRPGEALFLPAGILHSYLGGTGLEIMAASDNVLRGGLTEKHVDVAELLSTLSFRPYDLSLAATRTEQHQPGVNLTTFITPVPDFQLSLVNITTGATYLSQGPDILLGLDGVAMVEGAGDQFELRKGSQIFCAADEPYSVTGSGRFAKASVNQ